MAVDYTTTFTRLGTFIHETRLALERQSTDYIGSNIGADRILDQFNDNRDWVDNVLNTYESAASSLRGLVSSLNSQAVRYLGSQLQNELNSPSNSSSSILPLLIERMGEDSQTVLTNTCSLSSSAAVSNSGNGSLHVSRLRNDGVNNEGLIPEQVRLTCTRSVVSGGAEQFSIVGYQKTQANDGVSAPGSGQGGNARSVVSESVINNGELNSFLVLNTPDNWTIDTGTVGTNIKETASAIHAFDKSLEFVTSGTATIRVTQDLNVEGEKVYFLSVWLKRSGGAWTSGSTFTVKVSGTGWSAVNAFSADPNTGLSSSQFNPFTVFFATPKNVPADAKVTIEWTSASGIAVGKSVYISGCFVSVPRTHAGVHYAVTRGDTGFDIGDYFTCTTTNSRDGKFQDWVTRFYGYQFPSSGSPTISDSLV